MKKNKGRPAALLLALVMVLTNLLATPVWAEAGDVAINDTNFPDKNFRTFVSEKFDKNNDGILSRMELNRVGGIDVSRKDIASLQGIEHFKMLQKLNCRKNQITNLDVSNNPQLEELSCSENQMWALDVSKNPALRRLFCGENHLTDLVLNNPCLLYTSDAADDSPPV